MEYRIFMNTMYKEPQYCLRYSGIKRFLLAAYMRTSEITKVK
jgi:hypothetical protein